MSVSGTPGPWRVFVSHTSELRDHPAGRSYIAAVEEAISAAGHAIVDMRYFASHDEAPASVCIDTVRQSDIYLGVFGTRYGSPVLDRPDVSYTELEFDTAGGAGIPRLVFRLDTRAAVGIPPDALIDLEYGSRQQTFIERVTTTRLTVQPFTDPENLARLVERSLKTARRIRAGVVREQQPAQPRAEVVSKFVNAPPMSAPAYFADRHVESGLLGGCLADPAMRLITVVGRGGVGKTAVVCRLLRGLEAGEVPDQPPERRHMGVDGIVYLSKNGLHPVAFDNLFSDLCRLLPDDVATRVQALPPSTPPERLLLTVLEGFPIGLVVVMLDNVETALDPHTGALVDHDLHDALVTLLQAPQHAVKVIVTTQIPPAGLGDVAAAAQYELRLDEGLPSPHAEEVLRQLDRDGTLGLRDASAEELALARERTRGFPRALEALKAVLAADRTTDLAQVLDQLRDLTAANVVKELVGKAFDGLDAASQRVMQAVAVHPGPVSVVGVDYLLQPADPTTDAAPILTRLVNRELVRYNAGQYSLHPIDRGYALSRLATGSIEDPPGDFSLAALRERAADYYAEIRTPRQTWRTVDDIQPQLAEFELRCDNGDWDRAAEVLSAIDYDYLQVWSYHRLLIDLHGRLDGHLSDPARHVEHLNSVGISYYSVGDYKTAIDRHTETLTIARRIADRQSESAALTNLGNSLRFLGQCEAAIERLTEALAIARELDNRQGEANCLGSLGLCSCQLGDYQAGIDRHTEALEIARDIGDRDGEAIHLGNLGVCADGLGDYQAAIDRYTEALTIARDLRSRTGEALYLANLGFCSSHLGDYETALERYTRALAVTREIGYRYMEAVTLGGLGDLRMATGDPGQARPLLAEAIAIASDIGDAQSSAEARNGLARLLLETGDPAQALNVLDAAEVIDYPAERPRLLVLRGIAFLDVGRTADATDAFAEAVATAGDLIVKASTNVSALDNHALASCGQVVCGESTAMAGAIESFRRARAVTDAAGVVADTTRLFDLIARHDGDRALADVRAAIERR